MISIQNFDRFDCKQRPCVITFYAFRIDDQLESAAWSFDSQRDKENAVLIALGSYFAEHSSPGKC